MPGDWKQRASEGITVFRASRLEALLVPLRHLLDTQPPAHLLAPQTVVAAHPGMRQWLAGALARERGPGGIVANLEILLPSGFLDRLAAQVLKQGATSPQAWRREALRWRLFEVLREPPSDGLRELLDASDGPRRRFALADRLARIYTQYMAYRPDWLADWARGRGAFEGSGFHPALWRQLREAVGEPHRGERLAQLQAALGEAVAPELGDDPLHVFGLSHLAPAELRVLHALAAHRPVVFYLPDPSREYWGGLRGETARLRALAENPHSEDAEAAFLDQDHPLLAAWGRLGQHFMLQVQSLEAAVDMRHFRDEADHDRPPEALLERLQESIRRLQPALLAQDPRPFEERRADASLRVHACHTRLRELEALRDALLQARSDDPTLGPGDIVVMAPDIRAYLPLLPAVFGAPGDPTVPLPYHLADVPVANASPLLAAFRQLLSLPGGRDSAPELVDFLAQPDVARRLGLDEDALALLERALAEARAAWALDPAAREALGVPGIEAHTLAWAMDRLLAGLVHGGESTGELLDVAGERLSPVPGTAAAALALAALDHVLEQLARLRELSARPRPASVWAARLEALVEALFLPDAQAPGAYDMLDALRGAVRALATETQAAGGDPLLDWPVVRAWLVERLDAVPERQRFLAGGMTVCGMVPQRAIPFRFVAVLGLDEASFPRQDQDAGLDPIRRQGLRRLGDRDTRSDDRYLFLETVMSARKRLHLGWVGFDARSGKARNPAAPLAELMAALPSLPGEAPPWRVDHPLQPFDDACFGTDPARRSFSAEYAAMTAGPRPPAPLLASDLPRSDSPEQVLSLERVLRWCRDPARTVLADGLGARLDALGDRRLSADEPLEARLDVFDRQVRALVEQALADPDAAPPESPPEALVLAGVLPPGAAGAKAWARERKLAEQVLAAAAREDARCALVPRLAPAVVPAIARRVGRFTLEGELARVRGREGELVVFDVFAHREGEAELGLRERLPLFIAWALCRLAPENAGRSVRVVALLAKAGKTPWQASLAECDAAWRAADETTRAAMRESLETRLAFLLEAAARPATDPWPYFPLTSTALAQDKDDIGGAWLRELGYSPGYARLLARGLSPADDDAWQQALEDAARLLWNAIHPTPGLGS